MADQSLWQRTRGGLLLLALLVSASLLGCDDSKKRRANAGNWIRSSDPQEAAKGAQVFREILAENPDDVLAMVSLAGYARRNGDSAEASVLCQKVVRVAPESSQATTCQKLLHKDVKPDGAGAAIARPLVEAKGQAVAVSATFDIRTAPVPASTFITPLADTRGGARSRLEAR